MMKHFFADIYISMPKTHQVFEKNIVGEIIWNAHFVNYHKIVIFYPLKKVYTSELKFSQ
jgi:hypothetical protein